MATAVMDGLKKKGADIKWLCQSSQYFGTRWLSTVGSEKTFHRRLASSLPRAEMIKLPVQVRKKLGEQSFRGLIGDARNTVQV
eukprot:s3661_g4.t1